MIEGSDRRVHRRFNLTLPVQVLLPSAAEPAEETSTTDISATGISFTISRNLKPGSPMECVVTIPGEICNGAGIRMRCLARVVRVKTDPAGRTGVAAAVERFEFLKTEN